MGGCMVETTLDLHSRAYPSNPYGWTVCTSRDVYGIRLMVRATSTALWDDVQAALPPGHTIYAGTSRNLTYSIIWGAESDHAGDHRLYRDATCVYRTRDPHALLHALQSEASWQVAVHATQGMFIHAGAVTYGGRAILLPGTSGAGKSTLVSKLLALGATYYSDEYGVIDPQGRLRPFPCLVTLKDRPNGARRLRPDEFGGATGHAPAAVALVAFPTYVPGTTLHVERLARSQAALYLLEHMPAARLNPRHAMRAAGHAASGALCVGMRYGESTGEAESLIALLDETLDR
ncbi:MAG: hypothetical protein NVS2B16_35960 [Chloroflexota bacterium]